MGVTVEQIREIREKTGAGIMDCKKALKESNGDFDAAVTYLREKGLTAASKRSGRLAAEGLVGSYIHAGGKIGVIVELNCETDFVARNEDFHELLKDVAMHIAATNPQYLKKEDIPEDVIEHERSIYRKQALESGKPEKVVDKIVVGRLEKYFSEVCLMEQAFVKDPDVTIRQLLSEKIAKLGENISIRRFVRFVVGEGMEKKAMDFAAEVKAAL